MKNYLKTIVTFIFLMAAVAFVPTTSEAALNAPTNLRQTRQRIILLNLLGIR